jgi:hypothetical protein
VSWVEAYPATPSWKLVVVGAELHRPVPGLQLEPTGQIVAVPVHAPPEHTSADVQRLPSLHGAVLFAWTQPVSVLHESFVQTFASSQFVAAPATHTPPAHVSFAVQAFPSLHGFALFVKVQPEIGLHESVVQMLASLQESAVPA